MPDRRDEDLLELRVLVPRSALPSTPARVEAELVSQESSLELFGLPPRRFLEMVRDPRFPGRVLRVGKLRLARREDLLAHLHAVDEAPDEREREESAPPPPRSLAERLGLEEAPRRARGAARG